MTLIQFDAASGQRIGNVVRFVEGQANRLNPLDYDVAVEQAGGRSRLFRIATFTGSWAINTDKAVTFKYQTATPNTVSASNVLFPLPELSNSTTSPTVCAIARDGTAWFLLNVIHSNHDALTGASLTPTNLQFPRRDVLTISRTASTTGISVASCNTAQASASALSYFQ